MATGLDLKDSVQIADSILVIKKCLKFISAKDISDHSCICPVKSVIERTDYLLFDCQINCGSLSYFIH